jgi:hypothetical protein
MTDRHIIVRDMIVHRYMVDKGLSNFQEQLVQSRYWAFRKQERPAFDHLEDLAVNFGNPKFVELLERLTGEFGEWCQGGIAMTKYPVVVWNDARNKMLTGSYTVEGGIITVKSENGKTKSIRVGGSKPAALARIMLRELAADVAGGR